MTLPAIPDGMNINCGLYNSDLIGKITVSFNGEDVTDRCSAYDMEQGWVRCYRHGADGQIIIENDKAAFEVLYGSVEVKYK